MSKKEQERKATTEGEEAMAAVVNRNIAALLERRQAEERKKPVQERVADAITSFTGSMTFVYIHVLLFSGWILINVSWLPILRPFDPSLVILAMVASVEAIFLSTFVLISQNRMQALADRRAELNLHIDLLAEHEVTRIITLLTAIGERLGVEESRNPELEELARDVQPEKVLDTMDQVEQETAEKAPLGTEEEK
ncbi:hypothetical protein GEOBRER4_n0830 [Citrifermentans bremense]|uniref:DUF1003 domain-containing protein n=2 Tax=Citrifermentans bremense TaxID=60035 RepID=A0A6S6LYQ5_9BACT|nr:DUF1003 domain-containing protein [Citrifermentans bremense]BCG46050.1 hypothetical protein GEOBRER4_n0830 [Citrifermentans bremense]